jgi:L-alanine-DL-glutamate epimerase-like enolase superfamily enzyme
VSPTIDALTVRRMRVPLRRPWGADVTDIGVIAVDLTDSDGGRGHGFTWTPTIGATAVEALLRDDITDFILGRDAEPTELWPSLWTRLHEAGSGGITTIAMAGVDLALWDLSARRSDASITQLLGQRRDSVACYGSGVNLHYSLEELVAQVQRWVARGYSAVKIKVGKPDIGEDVDRVATVRELLGPDRLLMVDANQRWSLDQAIAGATALAPLGIHWLEEPLRADDLLGHRALRAESPIRIALGENLYTEYRFREFIDLDAVDVVQPNVIRVGGITSFLRIANMAATAGVELAPHLLPELSGQLALSLPQETQIEDVEDAGFGQLGALESPSPVIIDRARLTATNHVGLGFDFSSKEHHHVHQS